MLKISILIKENTINFQTEINFLYLKFIVLYLKLDVCSYFRKYGFFNIRNSIFYMRNSIIISIINYLILEIGYFILENVFLILENEF